MHNLESDEREAQNIQQIDVSAMKHVKTGNPHFGGTATDRPLEVPPDNWSPAPSTGTSINIFVRAEGVGLTDIENLMIKKLREVSEVNGLELDQEETEPTIGRKFKTKFEIPNEYSENILITDSDFILSDTTSAICITADMSFNTRLEADLKENIRTWSFYSARGQGW